MKKNKKKITTSQIVLIVSVIAVVLFTAASFILQFKTGVEISSTLVEYWYRFWTTEIVVLSGIRISKVFKGYHGIETDAYEDEYEEEDFE